MIIILPALGFNFKQNKRTNEQTSEANDGSWALRPTLFAPLLSTNPAIGLDWMQCNELD